MNINSHFAEMGGYFTSTSFEKEVLEAKGPITFYDSVTGKPLFVAPLNRSPEEFIQESEVHGWPSFRDGRPCYYLDSVILPLSHDSLLLTQNHFLRRGCLGECTSSQKLWRNSFSGRWVEKRIYNLIGLDLVSNATWIVDHHRNSSWPQPSRQERKPILHQPCQCCRPTQVGVNSFQ